MNTEKCAPTYQILAVDLAEVCNGSVRHVSVKKSIICPEEHNYECLPVCRQCNGRNVVEIQTQWSVKIKPGILEGQHIFKLGEGNQEPQKLDGDLIFEIKYLEDDVFQCQPIGDIVYKTTIPLHQAVWLVDITVRTPNIGSDLHLTKPLKGQIIRNGDAMYIPYEGRPDYFNPDPKKRGKLIVKFHVKWPKDLSSEQVQKIKALFNMRSEADTREKIMGLPLSQLSPEEEHRKMDELFPDTHWIEPKSPSKTGVLKTIQTVWKWFTLSKTVLSNTSPIARSILDISSATLSNPTPSECIFNEFKPATSSFPTPNVEEYSQLNPVFNPEVQSVSKETTNSLNENTVPSMEAGTKRILIGKPTREEVIEYLYLCNVEITEETNFWEESMHAYLNNVHYP